MRWLAIIVAVAAAFWSGYWAIEHQAIKSGVTNWAATARGAGWTVQYGDVSVRGFPNRLDTTIDSPVLTSPSRGVRWQAAFFQILRLSYTPAHMILVWPNRQEVTLAGRRFDLTSEKAQASLLVDIEGDWRLERFIGVFDGVDLSAETGESGAAKRVLLAARQALQPGTEDPVARTYDIAFEATDLTLGDDTLDRLAPSNQLPRLVNLAKLDATVTFDRPLDPAAMTGGHPVLQRITLNEARLQWGNIDLTLSGTLQPYFDGRADGEVTVRLRNWRGMLDIARSADWIDHQQFKALEMTLAKEALQKGPGDSVEAKLTVHGGVIFLDGLFLGEIPHRPTAR